MTALTQSLLNLVLLDYLILVLNCGIFDSLLSIIYTFSPFYSIFLFTFKSLLFINIQSGPESIVQNE